MKPKLGIIDKYRPLWEGGKSVEKYNIKVGFKIRMFVVSQITSQKQKNPNLLNQKDIEQLTNMIMELKQDKSTIPLEEQTCSLEDYQKFLFDFFSKVDYEDRHETVTIKTTSKFRLMASFIDVLSTWGPIDEEMVKCKKYCQFKAVDIFKALKKGEIPKRGGPKEQIDDNNNNNENKNININENKNDTKLNGINNNKNKDMQDNSKQNNNKNIQNNSNKDKKNKTNNSNKNNNINKTIKNNNQGQKNIISDSENKAYNKINTINPNKISNNNANINYGFNQEIIHNNNNNSNKGKEKNHMQNIKARNNLNLTTKNNDLNINNNNNINYVGKVVNTNPNDNNNLQTQKDPRIQRKINNEQKNNLLNKTEYREIKNNFQNHENQNDKNKINQNKKNHDSNNQNVNNQFQNIKNFNNIQTSNMNNNKLRNNKTNINPNINNNYNTEKNKNIHNINTNLNTNYKRKSLVVPSNDGNKKKRTFKGKYRLTTYIPVKYNTVPYFMLVENVRINNDNAKKALKRDKAENVLNLVLDSLDFLSYIQK